MKEYLSSVEDVLKEQKSTEEGLSQAEEKLLRMRYEENAEFQDIAEFLGIKEVAARKRVARAVAKCRKLLTEDISGK